MVIDGSLLGVGKDFVGVRNFLELVFGLGVVGVLVCEALKRLFPRGQDMGIETYQDGISAR